MVITMMMRIDKAMDSAWRNYREWAEREYKAGFVAGYAGNVTPDDTFNKVFIEGYGRGYEFSQMQDHASLKIGDMYEGYV